MGFVPKNMLPRLGFCFKMKMKPYEKGKSAMPLQIERKRIPYFAPWAKMKPFKAEKHYIEKGKISFDVKPNEAYANHVETAGFYCSSIISYGCNKSNNLRLMRHIVFPTLRRYPNLTECSLDRNFKGFTLLVNGVEADERATKFVFDGILHIYTRAESINVHRMIFTAPNSKACIERIEIENNSDNEVTVSLKDNDKEIITKPCFGQDRQKYRFFTQCDKAEIRLTPQTEGVINCAYCASDYNDDFRVNFESELKCRLDFISQMARLAVVKTPDERLNTMAFYSKIRACESIFKTKAGLMHSPGGGNYYAALWTNDQCEYVNPLFAYLGYEPGAEEALNCYKLYQKYISANKPLVSSIIAQGDGIWHGAGDRGDSEMYAYGCGRFLLTYGSVKIAEKYIDSIRKCLDFTISQIGANGVVKSDSDELENRLESGSYNLCTSCLAYDALISAAYLEHELGNAERADKYNNTAEKLKHSIEKYFGARVEGFDTYRYCEKEENLRAWIAIPLTVGIDSRSDETVKALLSDKLFQNGGIVSRSGEKIYWDRATLYALRGMFYTSHQNQATELLKAYTNSRLLGEHIPYPVEAYPEGNQAQLSAESGLYMRVFVEGVLGYRPTGFKTFTLKPNLPDDWNDFGIDRLFLCGKAADVAVSKNSAGYTVTVSLADKKITKTAAPGQAVSINLAE